MGWNRDEQPYTIPPAGPTKQELDDFVMGQTSGPTADNFRLDLRKLSKDHEEHNLQKQWNNRASVVFAREFLRLCEGNRWGYTVDSQRESFLAQRFADKLRRLKDIHQLQSRLSVTTEQDRYRILKEQQDGQKPDRHRARHVELFEFRKCLLEFHKDVPSAYMDVLLTLGVDGMSSEDTDPESRVKPYKFYRIPKVLISIEMAMSGAIVSETMRTLFMLVQYLSIQSSNPEWDRPFILPEPFFTGLGDLETGFKPYQWKEYTSQNTA
ncbi:hypothetical protein M422DRAFT_255289 [Sphaerobolus stellatus SS14]|uniref:Uncharacterized protein n=1 Tax=Sphaerobolus stellatus (strain SS14) TaxID=990650 RepID=A0A0C9V430_SPHS4|nr:hypothetical protein M422DRAFT_255289 [Sphaerobolus stellatus SS14]